MPAIDVLDDTFVRAAPGEVLAATASRWPGWLPDLALVVREERGVKGVRWSARSVTTSVTMQGTAEVWLEPVATGTVVHLFVRLDPLDPGPDQGRPPGRGGAAGRRARDLPDRVRRAWKRGLNQSKDVLEGETRA